MGLYIRNEETCRLARELAALMGVTITEAITVAVRERLERLQSGSISGLPTQNAIDTANGNTIRPS